MKQLSIKVNTASPLLYLLISLCALNFLNGYFYLTFITFFAVIIIRKGRIVCSGNFFLLLLFSVLMILFGFDYLFKINGINGLLKCFLYPMSFFIGENIASDENGESSEKRVQNNALLVVFSLALHGVLNMLNNFVTGGNQRNSIDIWTHSISAATRQACLFVLLCGIFFWCFFLQKNRLIKWICVLMTLAMLYYNAVIIASRTLIILHVIGILLPLLLCVIELSKNKDNSQYIIGLRVLIVALLLLLAYFVLYYTNLFGFKTIIDTSNLAARIQQGFFRDERNVSRSMYLNLMWEYPFGGNYLFTLTNRYGHDIVLSALNTGGIPSASVLLAFLVSFVYQIIKLYRMRVYSFEFRLLFLMIYAVAFIQFALEPILDGEHWFFGCVLMISGMVNYLIKHPASGEPEETDYENAAA